MPDDRVRVQHPFLPVGPTNPRPMSRKSYERTWKAKGWRLESTVRKSRKKEK